MLGQMFCHALVHRLGLELLASIRNIGSSKSATLKRLAP
jgi:hypothetical protein